MQSAVADVASAAEIGLKRIRLRSQSTISVRDSELAASRIYGGTIRRQRVIRSMVNASRMTRTVIALQRLTQVGLFRALTLPVFFRSTRFMIRVTQPAAKVS